ncbi:retrovirus-related pol polyprotein from transposon TNT 1-94 [Tanacetum coccineum]
MEDRKWTEDDRKEGDTLPILLSFTHCGNKAILRLLRIILVILPEHPSETKVFHNEDGNPARANIKQALGSYERSHKGVKASANSDIVYFFTSAQDGDPLQDDEEAVILREIVEQEKSQNPLNTSLDYACKYTKQIPELLVLIGQTCHRFNNSSEKLVAVTSKNKDKRVRFTEPDTSSGYTFTKTSYTSNIVSNKLMLSSTGVKLSTSASESQPSGNTKKDKIQQTSSSTQKNKVEAHPRKVKSSLKNKDCVVKPKGTANVQHSKLNANSEIKYVKCDGCMLSDNHDFCVLDFINNVNIRAKSKSVKKIGNACSLTRITTTTEVPLRKPTALENETLKPAVTLVYSRKPRKSNTNVPVSKSKVVQIVLWYLDSGCSKHMTGDRSQLTNFVNKFLGTVKFGNDHMEKILGYGDYQIRNVTISRVYYVEGLGHNLFSVGQFCDSNLEVAFRQHTCFIHNLEGVDLLTGSRGNNLYTLSLGDMMASSPICLLSKASKTKSWLWHRRLSHLNFGAINHLARHGLVRGLPKLKFEKDHLCSACAMGKSKKKPHKPKSEDTNQEKLYLLHMDLCGPMRVASVNGKKYILVIVDDYSRFTWVKFLRSKDEAPDFIIKFLKMIQVRLKVTVRRIRTDNGTEFVNQTLCEYYEKVGISHETYVARSPQQNEVVATACYTQNRSIIRLRHEKTPYELLHDKLPDLSFFHVFGALCYPTNDSENLGKLQPKADIGIFIGYAPTKKAFRIYNRRTKRIIKTIHVDFDELTAMASEHSSLGPTLHEMTPATISSGLVPNPPPSTPFVPPSRTDWDFLFQPMFDELLTAPPSVDCPTLEVIAPITKVAAPEPAASTGLPSSTTVNQEAPLPSNSQTTLETQSPIIPNDVEEDNHDLDVAHMNNDPFFGILILENHSGASSSSDVIPTVVHTAAPYSEHVTKWTKDHPLDNIIGELERPVSTRLQLHEQALFCYYDAFLSSVEPKTNKDALTQSCWIEVMQEELNESMCSKHLKIRGYKDFSRVCCSYEHGRLPNGCEDAFLNGNLWEEVYVSQPDGFVDKDNPNHVYKLRKPLYSETSLHARVDTPMVEKSKLDELREGKAVDPSHYRDADHAGCQDTRRSTSGSMQFLGDRLISWSSKRQKSAAISSTEAEYIALSKHIDIRFHFIKEHVENGVIELYFVNTEYQLADIFTKALGRERIEFLINKLGMGICNVGDS